MYITPVESMKNNDQNDIKTDGNEIRAYERYGEKTTGRSMLRSRSPMIRVKIYENTLGLNFDLIIHYSGSYLS